MVVIFVDSVYPPVGTMFHQINVNPIHGAIADLNVRSENSAPFADFFADLGVDVDLKLGEVPVNARGSRLPHVAEILAATRGDEWMDLGDDVADDGTDVPCNCPGFTLPPLAEVLARTGPSWKEASGHVEVHKMKVGPYEK